MHTMLGPKCLELKVGLRSAITLLRAIASGLGLTWRRGLGRHSSVIGTSNSVIILVAMDTPGTRLQFGRAQAFPVVQVKEPEKYKFSPRTLLKSIVKTMCAPRPLLRAACVSVCPSLTRPLCARERRVRHWRRAAARGMARFATRRNTVTFCNMTRHGKYAACKTTATRERARGASRTPAAG